MTQSIEGQAVTIARHDLPVLAILSTLLGFASISTDLYLPAMPAMGQALHAGAGAIALTVSGYLIGFSLGQLFWGPIGDRYGRRIPVAIGLVLFIIGAAGCALSGNVWEMIFWRVVQALGACAGVVLARAMVRDLYEGHRAAQMLSTLMTVMAIAPLLGPIAGGQILLLASWRAIFWVLVGVGVLTLAAMLYLPETLPVERRNYEKLSNAAARYVMLLPAPGDRLCRGRRVFLCGILCLYCRNPLHLHRLLPCLAAGLWSAVRHRHHRHHDHEYAQCAAGDAVWRRAAAAGGDGCCGAGRAGAGV